MKKTIFTLFILLGAATAHAQTDSLTFHHEVERQNAVTLREFAANPVIVAQKTVPRKDLYLYYNHIEWLQIGEATVAPVEDAEEIYFVQDGNIRFSSHIDSTLWSVPESPSPLFENAGPDAFPNVSYNGRSLYFSSRDLFGIGGYDIYRCDRDPDTGDLGEPQNLGYPFNSSADDLLFSETPDGQYIMFASNRSCGPSDITIYVARYENYTRFPASEAQVRDLSALRVSSEASAADKAFAFSKGGAARRVDITFEAPTPKFDYTFSVGKEGAFAEDNSLPDGICYQIQLFVTGNKVTLKQIKGLSPVFEHRQPSGKNLYAAGLFKTFADAQNALPKVRKAGFQSAYIIAYKDGKSIAVKAARAAESAITVVEEEVRIIK